ncbi:hypothetical protein G4B88_030788 [Cannabis sativa]|uniref:Uncharacterized protein n=1 Tax=Cannabis sativa TaxID=3483 RepID=A0A7J6H8M9_CANSA|nr:hypothetical protein G4B88_030788 [Cannabis sativa]
MRITPFLVSLTDYVTCMETLTLEKYLKRKLESPSSTKLIKMDYSNEDWLPCLIHDLGKVLLLPNFGGLDQWGQLEKDVTTEDL